jgi:predicted Zn-dependent protease with MMP-like domain
MDWKHAAAPSLDDFAALARAAFDALPQPFKGLAGDVVTASTTSRTTRR